MIRTVVVVLDLVLGAVAVAAGAGMIAGLPRGTREWLRGAPFKSLFWPGLVLLVIIGGSLFAGGILLMTDAHTGRLVSVEGGVGLLGWGGVVLSAAGYRHWAQLLPLVLGAAVMLLSFAVQAPG